MTKKVNLELSDLDNKYLENDLLDVDDWFEQRKKGKINKCKKRMMREWIPKLRSKGLSIPPTDEELVDLILAQPDYKNRVEREPETEEIGA